MLHTMPPCDLATVTDPFYSPRAFGQFPVWPVTSNAAVHILVSGWTFTHTSVRYVPRRELMGHGILGFRSDCQTPFQSSCSNVHSHPQNMENKNTGVLSERADSITGNIL